MAYAFFDAMNHRRFTDLEPVLSENVVFDFPGSGQVEGRRRVLLFLHALLRKYPQLEFTVSDVVSEDNRVCAVWSNKGIDSSGASYENRGMTLMVMAGTQVRFISDYFKDTSFVNNNL